MAKILEDSPENLRFLAGILQSGGLVAVPTETVYGLAANALDEDACRKVFAAKERPPGDPLIVHLYEIGLVEDVAADPPPCLQALAAAFWPGALTVVLRKKAAIPGVVTSGLDSVALRVPGHPVMRKLLKACGLPLAAPSANPFGYISPTTALHVQENLGGRIEWILDGGPCVIGLESTVIDIRDPAEPKLLRPGGIGEGEIEAVLGRPLVPGVTPSDDSASLAPGMLARHYSPLTPLVVATREEILAAGPGEEEGVLFFRKPESGKAGKAGQCSWLSETGDLEEAGRNLFGRLRELDASGVRRIWAESLPPEGPGLAINDRLRRASARPGTP